MFWWHGAHVATVWCCKSLKWWSQTVRALFIFLPDVFTSAYVHMGHRGSISRVAMATVIIRLLAQIQERMWDVVKFCWASCYRDSGDSAEEIFNDSWCFQSDTVCNQTTYLFAGIWRIHSQLRYITFISPWQFFLLTIKDQGRLFWSWKTPLRPHITSHLLCPAGCLHCAQRTSVHLPDITAQRCSNLGRRSVGHARGWSGSSFIIQSNWVCSCKMYCFYWEHWLDLAYMRALHAGGSREQRKCVTISYKCNTVIGHPTSKLSFNLKCITRFFLLLFFLQQIHILHK